MDLKPLEKFIAGCEVFEDFVVKVANMGAAGSEWGAVEDDEFWGTFAGEKLVVVELPGYER